MPAATHDTPDAIGSRAGVLELSLGGEIVSADDGVVAMFGYGADEMLGQAVDRLLPVVDPLRDLVITDGHVDPVVVKVEARRANGVPFPAEATLRLVGMGGEARVRCAVNELNDGDLAIEAQRYFDVAFDSAPIGMALANSDGEYVRVNAALCRILGRSADELIGHRDQEFTHADDRQADVDAAWEILNGKLSTHQCEKRYVRPDGSVAWVLVSVTFLRDEAGRPLSWVLQLQDITDRRAAEEALRRERDLSQAIVAAMHDGYMLTWNGRIVAINDALCRLTGFAREELVGARAPFPFWPPERRAEVAAVRERLVEQGGGEVEVVVMRKDGTRFPALLTSSAAKGPDGSTLGFVSTIRDITERKRREGELAHRAMSDGLTGLLNRGAFHEHLRVEVARAMASGSPLSLALIDLDHFKAINDTHGHPVGDRVLVDTAQRLRAAGRAGDHLARIGGEEFAWILPGTDGHGAMAAVERFRRSTEQANVGPVPRVTLSVGVCELSDADDVEELYRLADVALYAAKQRGRNRCVRHTPVGTPKARPQRTDA